jgi:hypothetical protein
MPDLTKALMEEAKRLGKKLEALHEERGSDPDLTRKLYYTHQIEQARKELDQLEKELRCQRAYTVYRELLRLDYVNQSVQYEITMEANRPAAFILRGPVGHGQQWLLHRFTAKLNLAPLHVDLAGRTNDTGPEGVWNELRKEFGLGAGAKREEIADELFQFWMTQDVAIIVHAIGATNVESVNAIIADFWVKLSELLDKRTPQPECKLLLFLVDENGGSLSWELEGVDQWSEAWNSRQPVRLEKLKCFDHDLLTEWVNSSADLPLHLRKNSDQAANRILSQSQGIPEETILKICKLCEADWRFFKGKIYG